MYDKNYSGAAPTVLENDISGNRAEQLFPLGVRDDIDWKANFWDRDVVFGKNSDPACETVGAPGRRRYPSDAERDWGSASANGPGPIRSRFKSYWTGSKYVYCYADYVPIGPSAF